jgi:hypothetical protein
MKKYFISRYVVPPFLAWALDGDEWPISDSGRFIPGERANGSLWIRGWVGPPDGLDTVEKNKTSCYLFSFAEAKAQNRTPFLATRFHFSSHVIFLLF